MLRSWAPALCLAIALSRSAAAQPTPQPRAALAPPPPVEIVVEGTPRARSASEARRERRVLALAPHRTASELLLTVPGVFVTQHSGEGKAHQIFFRGFDAVHGQDIELWVAGAPVNEVSNIHGQGYADLHFVMPEVVQAVRARPGAFDPRQGDFAIAGSMDFELGYEEPGITAKASAGSFGARRAFLAYRPPWASERTFAAVELYGSDGYGRARAADRATALAQVEVPLGSGLNATLMASTYAARFGSAGVLRLDDLEAGRIGRFDSYDPEQGGSSQRTQLAARIRRVSDVTELELAPFFVRRALVLRSNFTGFLENATHGDSIQQQNTATTLGARAHLKRSLSLVSEHDAMEAGVLLRSDFVQQSQRRISTVDASVTGTEVDAEVHATNVGGYLDLDLYPLRRLALRGGLRADALGFMVTDRRPEALAGRSAHGRHVGAKGSAEVQLGGGLSATASFGQGFRSPQARSLGDGEQTPFTRSVSQELGVRLRSNAGLNLVVAGFRTTLSDDLVFDEATSRNEAVPGTLRVGCVADLVAEPIEWFSSALGFTYTRATFRESGGRYAVGDTVPFVPEVVLRLDLGAKGSLASLGLGKLTGRVGAAVSSLYRRPLPFAELGSDVFLVDAVAGARLAGFELTLEAWNVLNRAWNDGEFVYASNFARGSASSQVPTRHVTTGAPRAFLLSLALTI